MSDNGMTTARAVAHADAGQRAQRAWTARVMGATWDQAAEVSGFTNKSNCLRAVRSYFGALPEPERRELRDLWRDRLEHLWRQSAQDVRQQKPGAVRAAVALAQRASALDGLDEPTRAVVYTPSEEAVQAYISTVLEQVGTVSAEADVFDAEVEE